MSKKNKGKSAHPSIQMPPRQTKDNTTAEISVLRFPDDTFEIRYFATAVERDRAKRGARIRFPHIRPYSVCVFAIGSNWEPTAWQKVVDMVAHTNKKGVLCWLAEIRDNCVQLPYAAINTMKDAGCMWVHDMGFEYIMLIDNDILPEPDLVLRLLNWDMPVVVPYIREKKKPEQAKEFYEKAKAQASKVYQKTRDKKAYEANLALAEEIYKYGFPIANPGYRPNEGFKPIIWAALTCILISCKVLNCFPECAPFGIVNIESGFYNKLMHYGHKIFQDTNTELKVATGPTYPADNKTIDAMWEFWKKADARRRSKPNRKPINPKDERDIYLPKEWGIKATSVEQDLQATKEVERENEQKGNG